MDIYSFPYSLPSYRARLAASMLGYKFNTINIDLMACEQKSESYLTINPIGKVPALVNSYKGEKLVISDSMAIIRYLARSNESNVWYPEEELDVAAKIDVYLSMVANELFESVEKGRIIKAFKMIDEAEYPACSSLAYDLFTQIDAELAKSKFLVTDYITIADIAVISTLVYFEEAGLSLDNHPNIQRWMKEIKTSEGFIVPTLL
ncbi:glutathione S-transferase family protein [Vibrio sp. SS-MA-C1-2]|uniref:glutathione S-transferase family protein n=1 Tax=Vibrio sp. SS-MA-C1-2 TaxID=2908646 RepID=UPI001F171D31|nr:glutathione S-transferase family protein [Vibrio sp. SS-MA-C1-2]UJF17046.1 glutathione S-transferase family protein [Vibrio sp. SS-MA-C1-2]